MLFLFVVAHDMPTKVVLICRTRTGYLYSVCVRLINVAEKTLLVESTLAVEASRANPLLIYLVSL